MIHKSQTHHNFSLFVLYNYVIEPTNIFLKYPKASFISKPYLTLLNSLNRINNIRFPILTTANGTVMTMPNFLWWTNKHQLMNDTTRNDTRHHPKDISKAHTHTRRTFGSTRYFTRTSSNLSKTTGPWSSWILAFELELELEFELEVMLVLSI